MKTESKQPCGSCRIVSPPEWELTPRRLEKLLLDHHLALGDQLPDKCEWEGWIADLRRELLIPEEGFQPFFVVSKRDDAVRGWVYAEMTRVEYGRPPAPFLSNLVVLPKWRGRGYGKFLLRRGENYFRRRREREVYLTCHPGIAYWYTNQGYQTVTPATEDDHDWIDEGHCLQRKSLIPLSAPGRL